MLSNNIISYNEYNTLYYAYVYYFDHHLTEADFNPDYIKQLNTDRMNNMPDETWFKPWKWWIMLSLDAWE